MDTRKSHELRVSSVKSKDNRADLLDEHHPYRHENAREVDDPAFEATSALDGCMLTASSLCTGLLLTPSFTSQLPHKGKELTGY